MKVTLGEHRRGKRDVKHERSENAPRRSSEAELRQSEVAESIADARRDRPAEDLDPWGRDADWNYPRNYGGL